MKSIKYFVLLGIMISGLGAQTFTKVATAGAKFLNIGLSPRAMGMGEAYVAVANDPSAVFWNPAGPANIKGDAVFIGYTNWIPNMVTPAVAYTKDIGLMGKITAVISGTNIGGMKEAVIDDDPNTPELTGNEFAYSAGQVGVGYARYYTDKFAAGVVAKLVFERYGSYTSASSFAIDAGTYFWTGYKTLRIAMTLQNLGADMKPHGTYLQTVMQGSDLVQLEYDYRSYPLPMAFKIGAAMEAIDRPDMRLTLSVEALHPTDNSETVSLGAEFAYNNMIYLRTGYRFADPTSYVCGLGAGVGVKLGKLDVDYSFSDMGYLPDVHRIGISYNF